MDLYCGAAFVVLAPEHQKLESVYFYAHSEEGARATVRSTMLAKYPGMQGEPLVCVSLVPRDRTLAYTKRMLDSVPPEGPAVLLYYGAPLHEHRKRLARLCVEYLEHFLGLAPIDWSLGSAVEEIKRIAGIIACIINATWDC